MPAAFVFPPLFRIRRQKRLKENERSGFPSTRPLTNGLSGGAPLTLKPAPASRAQPPQ